jgi:hypothetical protein
MLSPTPSPVSPLEAEAENALVATASLAIVPFSSADSASTPPSCCRRGRECDGCASTSLGVVTGRGGSRAGAVAARTIDGVVREWAPRGPRASDQAWDDPSGGRPRHRDIHDDLKAERGRARMEGQRARERRWKEGKSCGRGWKRSVAQSRRWKAGARKDDYGREVRLLSRRRFWAVMEGRSTTRGWKGTASREGGAGNARVVSLLGGTSNARVATPGCRGEGQAEPCTVDAYAMLLRSSRDTVWTICNKNRGKQKLCGITYLSVNTNNNIKEIMQKKAGRMGPRRASRSGGRTASRHGVGHEGEEIARVVGDGGCSASSRARIEGI